MRYDSTRKRWLPAGIATPDGHGYVYSDAAGAVHEVSVDSGTNRVIVRGTWVPLGFVGDKLYVAEIVQVRRGSFASGGYAVGRLASTGLSGGHPTFASQRSGDWHVSQLGAWLLDRADGFKQAPDRVLRLDLANGTILPWLSNVPNAQLVGFDGAGRPFIATGDPLRVLLVSDRDQATTVYTGARDAGWPELPAYVDAGNVWFSGFGISGNLEAPAWLYQPATGLVPAAPVTGAQVTVAGPCS